MPARPAETAAAGVAEPLDAPFEDALADERARNGRRGAWVRVGAAATWLAGCVLIGVVEGVAGWRAQL
ncbi:MAG: hypothetical protein ACK4N5_02825, partial [Myxococcales bacterium]